MIIVQAVGWFYPDTIGGTERYVAAIARRVRAAGHQVAIAAPDPTAEAPYEYEHERLPVFRYPIPGHPTRDEAQENRRVRGSEHFDVWLGRVKPHVFHAHTFVTGLGLAEVAVAKRIGARAIVTTHSARLGYSCQRGTMIRDGRALCDGVVEPPKCATCALQQRGVPVQLAAAVSRLPRAVARAAERLPGRLSTALSMPALIERNIERQRELFRTVDRFVVLSDFALKILVANGAPPARLVLNRLGVDDSTALQKSTPTGVPVRFGFVSRFEAIKGAETLASACRLLAPDCRFTLEFRGPVSGDGDRAVLDRVRALTAGDPRVSFAPAVQPSDVASTLCSYDVLICPSVVLEGGPTVALEAMNVGVPVFASVGSGVAEVIEDRRNGRLLPPGDPRALADAMRQAAADPGLVDAWRRQLPRIRRMDEVAADYLALYDEILAA